MERLTKTEEEIMQKIWSLKRCTVSDILKTYKKDTPPHSTISSVVRILEKKGFVDHKAYGRTYEYFPIIDKEDYSKRNISSLLRNYFQGSPKQLVSFLLKEEEINREELKDIISSFQNDDE